MKNLITQPDGQWYKLLNWGRVVPCWHGLDLKCGAIQELLVALDGLFSHLGHLFSVIVLQLINFSRFCAKGQVHNIRESDNLVTFISVCLVADRGDMCYHEQHCILLLYILYHVTRDFLTSDTIMQAGYQCNMKENVSFCFQVIVPRCYCKWNNTQVTQYVTVFKIKFVICRTKAQFCQNLYMIKKESLQILPFSVRGPSLILKTDVIFRNQVLCIIQD